MTTTLRTQADIEQLEQELTNSYLAIRPTPVLKEVVRDLEKLHRNYFEADAGPGGTRWKPLSPATVARKGHGEILEDTLAMRRAVTETGSAGAIRDVFDEGHNAGLSFGLDDGEIPYWKFHDQPTGALPWRPFIGITEREVDVIAERLLDHQLEGLVNAA